MIPLDVQLLVQMLFHDNSPSDVLPTDYAIAIEPYVDAVAIEAYVDAVAIEPYVDDDKALPYSPFFTK